MIETQHPSHGGPGRWRRRAPMLAAVLALSAAVVTQATPALAATTPEVSITCAGTNDCTATGTGFTPSGTVQVQALAGSTAFYTSTIAASAPTEICVQVLKPPCVDVPGGDFSAALPIDYGLTCNATAAGTMIEINANPHRLDLDALHCRRARQKGVMIVINPDAHSVGGLDDLEYGVSVARRGWLCKDDVWNTGSYNAMVDRIAQFRSRGR